MAVNALVDDALLLHGRQQVGQIGKPEAVQPGIEFEMHDRRAIHQLRGAAQTGQHFGAADRNSDARADAGFKLFRRGLAHAQYADVIRQGVDQLQGFRDGRHSKKTHAALVQ
ncbi:MAG: hypothetical protein J6U72_03525 [Clostridia bacterium]|nr:hypothetical protein [Clostridia bacterium]